LARWYWAGKRKPRIVGATQGSPWFWVVALEVSMPLSAYLIVSAIIFTIGVVGVLIRRNPLIIFMSIELMLNAVNLSFVAISSYLDSADGQMFVFIVLTVAAAEVVVGLAIIVSIFRTRRDIDVDDMNLLRG
jgi:NADH-quinone oxidoreductase subunit K